MEERRLVRVRDFAKLKNDKKSRMKKKVKGLVDASFKKNFEELRRYKEFISKKMAEEANDSDVRDYYSSPKNDLSNVDMQIF